MFSKGEQFHQYLHQPYDLDIKKCIVEAWKIYKSNFILFSAFGLFVMLTVSLLAKYGSFITLTGLGLIPVLIAGFYYTANCVDRGLSFGFSDFFIGFKQFGNLFLVGLLSSVFVLVGTTFFVLPGIYFYISYTFAIPFALFHGINFWEAMELSRKRIWVNFTSFIVLFFSLLFLNLLGAIFFGVGLVITLPISFITIYKVFQNVVGTRSI